jgi:hypothetical protein
VCADNHLQYFANTKNSSKRSARNIDLTFTNFPGISSETLEFGTSDHWPIIYKSEFISFEIINRFEVVRWRHYEVLLCLLQEYWKRQQEITQSIEWYRNYIRFVAALKNRLTVAHEKDKWRPTLPEEILAELKKVKKIKNRFYKRHREEDRVLVRNMTSEIRKEIYDYRSKRWNCFLSEIQHNHKNDTSVFWKYLSRIYRPISLLFNKLLVGNKQLTGEKEIVNELFQYYKNLFTLQDVSLIDNHTNQIEKEYKEILLRLNTCDMKVEPTTVLEIKRIIKNLKPKKSAGVDNTVADKSLHPG